MIKYLIFLIPICIMASKNAEIKKEQPYASLIKKALLARQNSYSPYSKYKVGSSIQTANGKIYSGSNIENASYGMTICAERSAIFSAISKGCRDFKSIVVITEDGKGYPCGGCRQVLNEFNPDMDVILADKNGKVTTKCKLSEILQNAFGPKNLN